MEQKNLFLHEENSFLHFHEGNAQTRLHPQERKCLQQEMKQYKELKNLQQKGKDERPATMILVGRRYHEVERWGIMMGS